MSVLFSNEDVFIVSHELYLEKIYGASRHSLKCVDLIFDSNLFNIEHPYIRDNQVNNVDYCLNFKRRKKTPKDTVNTDDELCSEVKYIKDKLLQLAENGYVKEYFSCEKTGVKENNIEARNASKCHFKTITKSFETFNGKNENDYSIVVTINDTDFVIPSKCQFYNCDIMHLSEKLPADVKFDFVLLDPPWRNKYIRRKRKKNEEEGYKMMYDSEICSIPLDQLITQDGLIAVWCTNSTSHINALKNNIFPSWNIKYISTWFWVKVTKSGEPVCDFSRPPGKQPYERIMFGCRPNRSELYKQPENKKIIISVPSAVHSHKPPLIELMGNYLSTEPKCLELFARYLLPGWTSFGDQVLSLQNMNLYSEKTFKL